MKITMKLKAVLCSALVLVSTLGQAKQVEITKDSCTLIEGAGETEALNLDKKQVVLSFFQRLAKLP